MNFVTIDDESIRNNLISGFEEKTGIALTESDSRRIFLEQLAIPLIAALNAINNTGKLNLIQHATNEYLDAIGARWGELGVRLPAQKATVTLKFTLSSAQTFDVIIQKGTRATTASSDLFFEIIEDLNITAGSTAGTVTAQAIETGTKYNELTVGLINKVVDPTAYVASVTNTTISQGGADIEMDDDYRERLKVVFSAPSTAGSIEAYKYWTYKADNTISDVSVSTPSAGNVTVTALLEGGQEPDASIIDKITDMLDSKRPLTDNVSVQPPDGVDYTINFTYYINKADSSQLSSIQANITGAVSEYKEWQRANLGRDINPDELRKLVLNAGASRIAITTPVITAISDAEYANDTTTTVTYGGLV